MNEPTRDQLVEALRALVEQIERSGAIDDHGHKLINLRAVADARAILANRARPVATDVCPSCRLVFPNGGTCRFGGCPMGGDF